jgi:hypothetical protein
MIPIGIWPPITARYDRDTFYSWFKSLSSFVLVVVAAQKGDKSMNRIRSQYTITKQASIAAALLAVVLSFAGTSMALNPQSTDSGTPPLTSVQVDPQSEQPATQQDEMQAEQHAQPGAMSSQQSTDTSSQSKRSESKGKKKHEAKSEDNEYVCTPDTPSTSAACDYR